MTSVPTTHHLQEAQNHIMEAIQKVELSLMGNSMLAAARGLGMADLVKHELLQIGLGLSKSMDSIKRIKEATMLE